MDQTELVAPWTNCSSRIYVEPWDPKIKNPHDNMPAKDRKPWRFIDVQKLAWTRQEVGVRDDKVFKDCPNGPPATGAGLDNWYDDSNQCFKAAPDDYTFD